MNNLLENKLKEKLSITKHSRAPIVKESITKHSRAPIVKESMCFAGYCLNKEGFNQSGCSDVYKPVCHSGQFFNNQCYLEIAQGAGLISKKKPPTFQGRDMLCDLYKRPEYYKQMAKDIMRYNIQKRIRHPGNA
tara:strand:- start:2161 stop:2562 length:402 start_codon:yes stop_codon:yes gene_type:complete